MTLVEIGEVASILNGFAFRSELFNTVGDGLPLVRIRDVIPGMSSTYYAGSYPKEYVVSNGDLLIGMDGEFNIAPWRGGKALLNQRVCKVTAVTGKADNSFLKFQLAAVLKDIEADTPFVTVKHLSSEDLKATKIPLPPLPEQQRLAALLDKADHLRRTRRYAQQLSDTFLQSVFWEMFGDPATNLKGWDVVTIEEALSKSRAGTQSGPFGSSLKRHEYVAEGIPVWGINNVRPNEFIEDEPLYITATKYQQLTTYSVEVGDILISRAGTTGRMCVARPIQSPSIIGTNLVRVSLDHAKMVPDYFTALFTYLPDRVGSLRTSDDENAYSFLNPSNLRLLRIPLPPLALQEQFAQVVRRTERLRRQQREATRQAEHLFQTLLARAFRGAV